MSEIQSFEGAMGILNTNPHSQFVHSSSRTHIKLAPKYLGNLKTGVIEQLDSQVSFFSKELDGVPVAYKNIRLLQNMGRIIADQTCIHFDIQADFILFKPQIGCTLSGIVNKVGKRHIGCLVHGKFNAWIPRRDQEKQKEDLIGEEIQFIVTDIFTNNDILSLKGRLVEQSMKLSKKRKRKISRSSYDTAESQDVDMQVASPRHIDKDAALSSTMIDNSHSDEPKMKKRKKHKHSLENSFSEQAVETSQENMSSFQVAGTNQSVDKSYQDSQELFGKIIQSEKCSSHSDEGCHSRKPKKKHKRKSQVEDTAGEAFTADQSYGNTTDVYNNSHTVHYSDTNFVGSLDESEEIKLRKVKKKHKRKSDGQDPADKSFNAGPSANGLLNNTTVNYNNSHTENHSAVDIDVSLDDSRETKIKKVKKKRKRKSQEQEPAGESFTAGTSANELGNNSTVSYNNLNTENHGDTDFGMSLNESKEAKLKKAKTKKRKMKQLDTETISTIAATSINQKEKTYDEKPMSYLEQLAVTQSSESLEELKDRTVGRHKKYRKGVKQSVNWY